MNPLHAMNFLLPPENFTYLVQVLKVHAFGRGNPEISYSLESFGGNIVVAVICEELHRIWELFAPIWRWHYLIYSFIMFQLLRFQGELRF